MTLKHFIFNSLYYLPNILFFFLINDTPTYGFFFFYFLLSLYCSKWLLLSIKYELKSPIKKKWTLIFKLEFYHGFIFTTIQKYQIKIVWECGCGCFSKCFSCRNVLKWYFFIFKKLFLRSAHQNDPKHIKN